MSSVQHSSGAVVDVRTIIPRERHPLIFNTFLELAPGQDFILVNDHDPKPLYYQSPDGGLHSSFSPSPRNV